MLILMASVTFAKKKHTVLNIKSDENVCSNQVHIDGCEVAKEGMQMALLQALGILVKNKSNGLKIRPGHNGGVF